MQMLTYQEWLKFYGIKQEFIDCDCCDGNGEDFCSECGSPVTCEECNGDGQVDGTRKEYTNIRNRLMNLMEKQEKEKKGG